MTTSTATEVERRRREARSARASFGSDLGDGLSAMLERTTRVRFPNARYRADPVAFFREVLGLEPWERQRDILEAVRDHPRAAISSGHKIGKSNCAAGLALWWYCSWPDARVVMSSTTARQVDQILWRELRMLRARSGRCVACKEADPDGHVIPRPCQHSAIIEGEQGELARTGLKADDFREVTGFTARESEAVAGISGRRLLYILDEASGIPEEIFEAISGNLAGGGRIVLFGNPTRNEGEFFEAFNAKSHLYFTMRVSSEETPNATEGREIIPGLATRDWIEEKKDEWGEDSPLYAVRVRGQHVTIEEGKAFSLHMIVAAEQRWADTSPEGRLHIGLDPAGDTGTGDESAFCVRRGLKMLALRAKRGLNDAAHITELFALIQEFGLPRETPVVCFDRDGIIGARLFGALQAVIDREPPPFDLVAVRASDRAVRQPQLLHLVRDELVENLRQWFRDGGAILEDVKLEKELHAFELKNDLKGRQKATPKDVLRKLLGRSPDRFDALALSVWERASMIDASDAEREAEARRTTALSGAPYRVAEQTFDPYSAEDAWKR
jgi:hypothetical protein